MSQLVSYTVGQFDPSVFLLCHRWLTTTNLSYRFPILETSATALCGTTGVYIYICWYHFIQLLYLNVWEVNGEMCGWYYILPQRLNAHGVDWSKLDIHTRMPSNNQKRLNFFGFWCFDDNKQIKGNQKTTFGLETKTSKTSLILIFLVFSRFAETVWKATFEFLSENSKSVTFELRPYGRGSFSNTFRGSFSNTEQSKVRFHCQG